MMYSKIDVLQIEHSSMCNAACPQCLREWKEGDYSFINQTYLPLDFYTDRIPDAVYKKLSMINFCGTVGDPCTAPNFVEVCAYIKQTYPHIKLVISSNGGMKSADWWARLGSTLTKDDCVIFGIDGLEDTNWIYRVNVRWSKLMENVKAFIGAGGQAQWQFIPFQHNEHQIKEAEDLSKELGFQRFFTIFNNRFVIESVFNRPARGGDGKVLMPPVAEEKQSRLLRRDKPTPKEHEEWIAKAQQGTISCQAQKDNELYIDAESHIIPCCFIAGAKFTLHPTENPYDGYYDLWTKYGGDNIKLQLHSWEEIMEGDFFKELTASWTKKFKEGRLFVCSAVCSRTDAQISQYNQKYE